MRTLQEKKKIRFIVWSIPILLILFILSNLLPHFDIGHNTISSIQPEVNALKDCNNLNATSYNNSINIIHRIDSVAKKKNSKIQKSSKDSTFIVDNLSAIRKELQNSNTKSITDLITKIETKSNAYAEKYNNETKKEWEISIFDWPLIVIYLIITLVYFNFNLKDIQSIFGKVKSVNIFGNEIAFSEEVKINTELSIKQYRNQIKETFSYQIQKEQLNDKLRYFVDEVRTYLAVKNDLRDKSNVNLRCTIHIQDILFNETLYQLLDYYPISTGGSGRIKSIRFGIIGLAWRTEESKILGWVDNNKDQLIKDWGLDISETTSDSKTKSFAAITIKSEEGTRLGVIYFDSKQENLFGDQTKPIAQDKADEFEAFVKNRCSEKSILKSLTNIQNSLSDKFLQIRIYE
jgi:hypothetical protein